MRSASHGLFPPLQMPACHPTPCVRKRAVSHHVFRGVQTCPLLSAGPRWARADAVWWSAAGTGERSPILFDGALVNAASSVLPMVRFPPCSFRDSPYRLPSFLLSCSRGAIGGPFPIPHHTNKASLALCACMCVLSVHRWRRCAASRPPLVPNRRTPLRPSGLLLSLSPGPLGGPRSRLPTMSPRSLRASLARQARQ